MRQPFYYAGKNTWYVWLDDRKVSLGIRGESSKEEAFKEWHKLIVNGKPATNADATVKTVIDGFLADVKIRVTLGCLRNYELFLLPFTKRYGKRQTETLTVAEAEAYARKPEWSMTYRANFLATLITAFRWAERERIISRNPLIGIRKPQKASRGAKAIVSAEDHAQLVAHADPHFGAFLRLLYLTGARPGEIAGLKGEDVDLENGIAILTEHKCAHLGKSRVLFLSDEAKSIIRGLDRVQGLLFKGQNGERMTAKAVGLRLRRLCVKAGVKHCIPYGYRHGFATDALANGVPDAQVAALLGHSGTAMLHKHYSHLGARANSLRDALGRVR